ncbi:MAG: CoB--CoM heterodisulfide reductase iron-sulfur subunit B family protein [Thermoanaerobacteraceae bacterium]|uniref:CoB--CoM heterodisulfide reductase iron-sulfur subunit B family protein n=1 Tax=Thermanaeromonas sp. C210 TaxID=2731925 RepID=UPI00155CEAC6|nr:CoB--CoM heterodisulfide reductase iron-sulfur subunit B family protein [Thermanaeromonas sp. C210]MBE3580450.1 CoB--CoM heterodisulfide reductase iron-sulfur subunit B family protein [Thermoanaerobacteraceae bacterium]GFN24113.1 heterodisulfide reductase subunit B [Thermanaeromonas sp. C210]
MRYAYYPGCSLEATAKEYNQSAKIVARHLGLELWEIPDWSCCGATAAHNNDHLLSLALPARNLALAEAEGLDVAVPCAACFNRLRAAEEAVRESEAMRATIGEIIGRDYRATNRTRALLDVMVNGVGLEKIGEQVVKPLTGLKLACYYGCLLVRPPKLTAFDDPEDPMTMDRLVAALGGEAVTWSYKTECCGGSLATARTDIGARMIYQILRRARDAGAEAIVTACPLCMLNLDMRQGQAAAAQGDRLNLPIFYFTELMGVALGYAPKDLGLTTHFVNPLPLLEAKDVLRHPATRRERA